MIKSFKKSENGQSLLIIVLVMIIALTVGLALISRSITGIKTSTEEVSSQRALGAAEAGIEQSIKANSAISKSSFGSVAKFQTTLSLINGKSFLVNGGDEVQADDNVDVWLSDYSTQSARLYLNPVSLANITISFNTATDNCANLSINSAIEVDVISGSKISPIQNTYVYDPCVARRTSNHFSAPQVGAGNIISGISFSNKTPVISVSNGLFMRIVPIYAGTKIGISSDVSLPSQGSIITSVGSSGTTQRSVSVYQGYPKIPVEFFPYTLFSP
jgi:hypothetical protein